MKRTLLVLAIAAWRGYEYWVAKRAAAAGAAAHAARSAAASRARAQMRTAQLADESADRLAHRGRDEVELTSLDRPAEMAGFAVSPNGRFSDVHRGLRGQR